MGFIKGQGIIPYSEAEIENMFTRWDALRNVGKLETWPRYHETSVDFPYISLTRFSGVQTITDYPDLIDYVRADKVSVGADSSFAGTSGTNSFTATSQEFVNALWESIEHFSGVTYYLTIGGAEHEVTSVNKTTRVISLDSTPTGTSCEIYPYRIAGSSTTARVFSLQGLGLIGMGDADRYFVGGLARRDHMQRITGTINTTQTIIAPLADTANLIGAFSIGQNNPPGTSNRLTSTGDSNRNALDFDSADSPDARVQGTTATSKTHGPSWSVEIYQHVGRI